MDVSEWLIELTQTLADLARLLAQANLEQGTQTQAKLDHLTSLSQQMLTNQGVIMSEIDDLKIAVDGLVTSIPAEFDEIAAKVDALEAVIASGADATAELADLKQQIAATTERITAATAEIGNLSTAGDDAPPQP